MPLTRGILVADHVKVAVPFKSIGERKHKCQRCRELEQLGNAARFQAALTGSGAIAQGSGSTAMGEGSVNIGGDVGGNVITGDSTTIIHQYGEYAIPLPDDLQELRDAYEEYLIEEYKDHIIHGFAPQVAGRVLSLPLADISLPLRAVQGRPAVAEFAEQDLRKRLEAELDWRASYEEMEKRFARLEARLAAQQSLDLAELLDNPRAVLLGDPGSGKTTLTRYVTYALATEDFRHVGPGVAGLVPVLIRIASYAKVFEQDRRLHLLDYVEEVLTPNRQHGRFLRRMIEEGHCLIILDGLDEVESNLRREVTERIRALVAGYGENRFLVTSRIIGYEQSPLTSDFVHATLQDLTEADQTRFVRLWYDAIEEAIHTDSQVRQGADALVGALRNKPQLSRLAANPLLLTIMVLMHWRGVKLPSRRVQVYESATDTLIEYWRAQPGGEALDALEIKAILAPIAHYILSSNVGGVIAESDLLPRFHQGIQDQRGCSRSEARHIARDMLQALNEQSGIFLERGRDEHGRPVYGFLHQTFGEYLAALYLAEKIQAGRFELELYIHRSVWHEPLLLMAGHLSIYSSSQANTLLLDILDYPALYEETLRRNLFQAVDCLADDIRVKPDLRRRVLTLLAQAISDEAPQVREKAVDSYRRLAVTSHHEVAAGLLQREYSLDAPDSATKFKPEIQLGIATALLHFGEVGTARAIVWSLSEQDEFKSRAQGLRIEYWPEEAAGYLLYLHSLPDYFPIVVDDDLANCRNGPVGAMLLYRILSAEDFLQFIDRLQQQVKDNKKEYYLDWIRTLATADEDSAFAPYMAEDILPRLRRLAAARLIQDAAYREEAVKVLGEIVAQEATEATEAAQVLLKNRVIESIDLQLLTDIALVPDRDDAPGAIETLLKVDYETLGLSAAIHLLAVDSQTEYAGARSWRLDPAFHAGLKPVSRSWKRVLSTWRFPNLPTLPSFITVRNASAPVSSC